MKRILLSLTMVLAGLMGGASPALAQSCTLTITGEILYPDQFNRLFEINNHLRNMQPDMARARYDLQHSRDENVRADAWDFLADCQAFQQEAANLSRFLNSIPRTTLVEPADALSRVAFDNFVRMLQNNPNARGRTYLYDSRTNRTGFPVDASSLTQRGSAQQGNRSPAPRPAPVAPLSNGGRLPVSGDRPFGQGDVR